MFTLDTSIMRCLSHLIVTDPGEMAEDSRISTRLRPGETANTYRIRDHRLWRARPGPVLTRLSGRAIGPDIHLAINSDRHATAVEVHEVDMGRTCLSACLEGFATITQGGATVTASGTTGAIFRGERGLRLDSSDRSLRLNLWVSDRLMMRVLTGLLPAQRDMLPRFRLDFDWSSPAGAPLHRLVAHLLAELPEGDGMTASPTAITSFAELLAETMLRRLPHSHSDALRQPHLAATPKHLRRAEAYMEAHAHESLTMEKVAEAAGCSMRALHDAFRRFRDTTPRAALLALRLQRAHLLLRTERQMPPGVLARRAGFTNATRFAEAYRERFGEAPADTQNRSSIGGTQPRGSDPGSPAPEIGTGDT